MGEEKERCIKVTVVKYYNPDPTNYGESDYDGYWHPYVTTIEGMAAFDKSSVDEGHATIIRFLEIADDEDEIEYEFSVVEFTKHQDGTVTEEVVYTVPNQTIEWIEPNWITEEKQKVQDLVDVDAFVQQQVLEEARASVALDRDPEIGTYAISGPQLLPFIIPGKEKPDEDNV